MGQKAGVHEVQRSQKWTAAAKLQPTIPKSDRLLGTRVPVAVLFENLADGLTLDEIIDAYPALSRETALLALQQAQALLQRQQATA